MKRLGPILALLCSLIVVGLFAFRVPAQSGPDKARTEWTESEHAALEAYEEGNLLTARRLAEEALDADDNSLVGHYVMGCVQREAEGSLPRALFHLGRARELYETTWELAPRPEDAPWAIHRDTLFALTEVTLEMELHEYRLRLIDFYDDLYSPDMIAQRAWSLMALGDYDRAQAYAQQAADSNDDWQRSLGLNTGCAIAEVANLRTERFEACLAAYDFASERDSGDPTQSPEEAVNVAVHAYNAAAAAHGVLEFSTAEELAERGARRLAFTPANPWRFLALHYLAEARTSDVVAALEQMNRWRNRQPPNLRGQTRAENDVAYALVLLVTGDPETGLQLMDFAIDSPDRRGLTTSDAESALGAHALIRREHRELLEAFEEELAVLGLGEARPSVLERLERAGEHWADRERIVGTLTNDERLVSTLRPYLGAGLQPLPYWLVGELIEVTSPGVMQVALEQAEAEDEDERFAPYFDAVRAEIAYHRGQWRDAATTAAEAGNALPEHEQLLRARMTAIMADSFWRRGEADLALDAFALALEQDPGVIRRMGLRLPAQVEDVSGTDQSAQAARVLSRSPRIRRQDGAFRIEVEETGDSLKACIRTRLGDRVDCTEVRLEDAVFEDAESGEEEVIPPFEQLYLAVHRELFTMPIQLETIDRNSLDGRTTGSSQTARENVQNALERMRDGR